MKKISKISTAILILCSALLSGQELPDANIIVKKTQDRDDGAYVTQDMTLELVSKKGKIRSQETKVLRKYYGKERRQAIFYTYPSNVAGTSFLVYDYPEADKDDDQWLYLPALRKTRRISAANRGDYFLGTDLTYEDIKLGPKLSDQDYVHNTIAQEEVDGNNCYVIESIPINDKTARELGYSKLKAWVDANIWMVRKGEFWDIAGNKLKTVAVQDIREIEGIWTAHALRVVNHKTGHKTNFLFDNTDYVSALEDEVFTEQALVRGF